EGQPCQNLNHSKGHAENQQLQGLGNGVEPKGGKIDFFSEKGGGNGINHIPEEAAVQQPPKNRGDSAEEKHLIISSLGFLQTFAESQIPAHQRQQQSVAGIAEHH